MARPLIVGIGEILWDMLPAGRQLGGAPANFAYHANALGASGAVVSRVGDDEPGHAIVARLESLGLETRYVQRDPTHPTGRVDVRLDARGVPDYVIHEGAAWDSLAPSAELLRLTPDADAVCFGTLAQRSPVSRETIRSFLRATRPACLRVFDINLRQSYFDKDALHHGLVAADVLKLNDEELPVVGSVLGIAGEGEAIAGALLVAYDLRLTALTRGANGSSLYARDRTSHHDGVPPKKIGDTVGAGDAFTAALVTGLLEGHDLDRVHAFASRLASYVCSKHGATPPIPAELVESR